VLVCFALTEEARPFLRFARGRADVQVLLTGVGQANAERSLRAALAKGRPSLVLSCGYAGALDPALKLGEVLFSLGEVATMKARLLATGACEARFHCTERIAATGEAKKALRQTTGADAVEMESETIHRVCREQGLPCATVRAISDTALEDLPLDFNLLMSQDQRLDYAKLSGAILRSPGSIPALVRFRKQTRLASQELARVLAGFLWGESGLVP
jgi:adenosylhomocysteine nucleosidase